MKDYQWAFAFVVAMMVILIISVLFFLPLAHECPVLKASMLEAQPIVGCLI